MLSAGDFEIVTEKIMKKKKKQYQRSQLVIIILSNTRFFVLESDLSHIPIDLAYLVGEANNLTHKTS